MRTVGADPRDPSKEGETLGETVIASDRQQPWLLPHESVSVATRPGLGDCAKLLAKREREKV